VITVMLKVLMYMMYPKMEQIEMMQKKPSKIKRC
jgi:hypothetical protein